MVKRKTKKRAGQKPGPKKGSENKKQRDGTVGLAASVLTPIAIEVIKPEKIDDCFAFLFLL